MSSSSSTSSLSSSSSSYGVIEIWGVDLPFVSGNIMLRESDSTIIYYDDNNICLIRDDGDTGIILNNLSIEGQGELKIEISGEYNATHAYIRPTMIAAASLMVSSSSSSTHSQSSSSSSSSSSRGESSSSTSSESFLNTSSSNSSTSSSSEKISSSSSSTSGGLSISSSSTSGGLSTSSSSSSSSNSSSSSSSGAFVPLTYDLGDIFGRYDPAPSGGCYRIVDTQGIESPNRRSTLVVSSPILVDDDFGFRINNNNVTSDYVYEKDQHRDPSDTNPCNRIHEVAAGEVLLADVPPNATVYIRVFNNQGGPAELYGEVTFEEYQS